VDPEQLYQEVLAEEQQKGSSAPVAEGRAKAARSRAEAGSPHPKEPKWWPGAQPHLDGGDAGGGEEAPAEEEAAQEPAAEEAPAAEPAAEAASQPEPAPEPEPAPAEQPAPAAAPAEQAPAQQPAAAAAAPAAATATQTIPTTGVSHGTATGNRMRPEDGVATPAMLDGQQAMYERRRLIDEVVKTGVPAAAASQRDNSSSGALAVLYLLIPLLVIGFLAFAGDDTEPSSAEEGGGPPSEQEESSSGANTIVAANNAFETQELTAEAGGTVSGTLENQDAVEHDIAFFESPEDATNLESELYSSDPAPGGESVDFEFAAPEEPGDYPFLCKFHPATMTGTLLVEEAGGGGGGGGGGSDEGGDG